MKNIHNQYIVNKQLPTIEFTNGFRVSPLETQCGEVIYTHHFTPSVEFDSREVVQIYCENLCALVEWWLHLEIDKPTYLYSVTNPRMHSFRCKLLNSEIQIVETLSRRLITSSAKEYSSGTYDLTDIPYIINLEVLAESYLEKAPPWPKILKIAYGG